MSKAQVIHKKGPPGCMKWEDWHVADPKLGEVRIRHTAIGVNYADTYHRAGISHPWPVPEEPVVIGCLLYTSPSPRDVEESRMPSSA